ncbi:hypothetical protein [Piscirickettsia salmonis]|uniref:hypothetical protein n=1 Tax=Piscirickettsia salmonis TaxID=1238 RepID=UPI0012BAC1AE|nr:hypothetical protein [Piscirickettsia salmonis]QGP40840.1 hypothetical protein Psal182_03031 [Piscirickettsia salmonis]
MKFECPITLDELNPREVQIYAVKSQKDDGKNSNLYSIRGIEKAAFNQLKFCPITRATTFTPLTFDEYLTITDNNQKNPSIVEVTVVSEKKFKEKLPSKSEINFLTYAKYAKDLVAALSMLTRIRLNSEENQQFLINHTQHALNLTYALSALGQTRLANQENWQLLINHIRYTENLTYGLHALQQAGLANQVNWQLLTNHAEYASNLTYGLDTLRIIGLANQANWQLLSNHSQYAQNLTEALNTLQQAGLASQTNWQLLSNHSQYAQNLTEALNTLQQAGLASQTNWQFLAKHAAQAPQLADGLVNPKQPSTNIKPILKAHLLKNITDHLNQENDTNFSDCNAVRRLCFIVSACQTNKTEIIGQLAELLNQPQYYLLKEEISPNSEAVRKRDIRSFARYGAKSDSRYFLNLQDRRNKRYFSGFKPEKIAEAALLFERNQRLALHPHDLAAALE